MECEFEVLNDSFLLIFFRKFSTHLINLQSNHADRSNPYNPIIFKVVKIRSQPSLFYPNPSNLDWIDITIGNLQHTLLERRVGFWYLAVKIELLVCNIPCIKNRLSNQSLSLSLKMLQLGHIKTKDLFFYFPTKI